MTEYTKEDKELMQRILDIAVPAVIKQGCQAYSAGSCYYRLTQHPPFTDPTVLKCAIGHVVLDEYYTENMENNDPSLAFVNKALSSSLGVTGEEVHRIVDFLRGLQEAHDHADEDDAYFVNSFKDAVENLVREYGLKTPESS